MEGEMAITVAVKPDIAGFGDAVRLALVKACLNQALSLLDADSMAWSLTDRALAAVLDFERIGASE